MRMFSEWQEQRLRTPLEITNFIGVPLGMLQNEVAGIYGQKLLADLGRILGYYEIYEWGARFLTEGADDGFLPAQLPFMRAALLIDKQARFVFSRPAEFTVNAYDPNDDSETTKDNISVLQNLLDNVMEKNHLAEKCLKAFKDACIGERVAVTLDFNDHGVFVRFHPSYSFVFEQDAYERLTKFIVFWTTQDSIDKAEQRIRKKKWVLNEQGFCVISDEVYDGNGRKLEDQSQDDIVTKFTYLPVMVILNDGLTGDCDGESDIRRLGLYEEWYSKLANADMDAGRQGMNPIRYAIDAQPTSLENLKVNPGAFWDIASNTDLEDSVRADVGLLEPSGSYSDPLSNTLDRLASMMNETIDVPNISADSMTGTITSGKSLQALYWPLTMRSDEKMLTWLPALRFIGNTIIDGVRLYPESARPYIPEAVPDLNYNLLVENPYSLPEDEAEEKALDLQEVNARSRSRKTYIRRWQQLSDAEADKELQQILTEERMFESGYTSSMLGGTLNIDTDAIATAAEQSAQAVEQNLESSSTQTTESTATVQE